MKKIFILTSVVIFLLTFTVAFAGCKIAAVEEAIEEGVEEVADAGEEAGQEPWTLGIANLTYTHSFYVPLEELLPQMEANYNVEIINKSCDFSLEQQFADIDNLIELGVDAIGVNPVDSVAIEPAVQKIIDAGIPVFSIANIVDVEGNVNAILEEYKRFEENANMIASYLNEEGVVFYVSGIIGNWASDSRQAGFVETISDYPDITFDWGPSDFDGEKAATLVEGWLASNDKIDAIVFVGETSGMAGLEVIKNAGREDEIIVITDGGEDVGINSVKSGDTLADALIAPDLFWWWIIQSGYKTMMGAEGNLYMPTPHILLPETYDVLEQNGMVGIEDYDWITPDEAFDQISQAIDFFGIATVK